MSFADILGNETSWSGITSMITIKNDVNRSGITSVITVKNDVNRSGITGVITFSIQSCRTCYATQHLCQRSFYKIFVKWTLTEMECSVTGTTNLDREWSIVTTRPFSLPCK